MGNNKGPNVRIIGTRDTGTGKSLHIGPLPFYVSVEREDQQLYDIIEYTFSFIEKGTDVKIPREYKGAGPWKEGKFGSVEWYIRNASNPNRRQVETSTLWKLLENEPWQSERHYELTLLESDLYSPGTRFVFGETIPKISNDGRFYPDRISGDGINVTGIILSVNRMKKWYGRGWGEAFHTNLLHEMGHFYGLPSSESPNFIRNDDPRKKNKLDERHCDDRLCIMEQVNIHGRLPLDDKAKILSRKNPKKFCDYDLKALKENIRKLYEV